MTTPTKLREWRLANGLTQTEAAARFKKSLRTYQRYENGPPSTSLPAVVLDTLILASAAHHAAARKAEQDLNEEAIRKVEAMATKPRKAVGEPFDASGWKLPAPVATPALDEQLPFDPRYDWDDDAPEDDQ